MLFVFFVDLFLFWQGGGAAAAAAAAAGGSGGAAGGSGGAAAGGGTAAAGCGSRMPLLPRHSRCAMLRSVTLLHDQVGL